MAGDPNPSSTHPPLPPTTEDIRFSHLRLLRSRRVGSSTYHRLLAEYGSAENALDALPGIAAEAGVQNYEICPKNVIARELQAAQRVRAQLLIYGHAGYPALLAETEDAPPLLWARGDLSLLDRRSVTVIGARNASALGIRTARSLARDLAADDIALVSTLSRGIDTTVHAAAAEHGSIVVQNGALDGRGAQEAADLSDHIDRAGLRLTEQPFGAETHTPMRSRLVAALGRVCVVVEAAHKSGTLATAREAADLGRDVLAVPGHPFDARAAGCNALIRDGATLVRGARDVLEALAPIAAPALEKLTSGMPLDARLSDLTKPTRPGGEESGATQALHAQILRQLGPDPVAIDQLIRNLRARPANLGQVLTELELGGRIRRHAGGLLSRSA